MPCGYSTPSEKEPKMRITWYGHAAFLIETQGLRIILDPYRSPDSGGYLPIEEPADLVVVSHENDRYHSHLGQILPPFQVVRALDLPAEGEVAGGIRFKAVRVFETPEQARGRSDDRPLPDRGPASGIPWRPGAPTHRDRAISIAGRQIVLVPAGGPPTIELHEIPPLLEAIGPRLVLPMHYKTPKINLKIQPVERFLELLPQDPIVRSGSSSIEITTETLPARRTIVVLDHAR